MRTIVELGYFRGTSTVQLGDWMPVVPRTANRKPVSVEVPKPIAEDYKEAANCLAVSPKASAALSRRCLQHILHDHGYKKSNLSQEIDALLAETDALKALPLLVRTTVDAIRNFGNFSAHPLTDVTSLQVSHSEIRHTLAHGYIDLSVSKKDTIVGIRSFGRDKANPSEITYEHISLTRLAAEAKKAANFCTRWQHLHFDIHQRFGWVAPAMSAGRISQGQQGLILEARALLKK